MALLAAVLNAQCTAATAMFDTVTLHTDDPGTDGSNEDEGVTAETLTWSTAASGASTASCTFSAITGDWTHLGLWDSTTFVGSIAKDISFDTADDLVVAFEVSVEEAE